MVSLEAMALGQPLLRNRTGGWQEQLLGGINGFDLGETGLTPQPQHVQLLQRLRDPLLTTNSQLQTMAQAARAKAKSFSQMNYSNWLLN